MKLNKLVYLGIGLLALGMTSCVGDLDLDPIDPNSNYADPSSMEFMESAFAECYSSLLSGPTGQGSSIVSGADGGTANYTRVLFMTNEFPTDEAFWIWWSDEGVPDMVQVTFNAGNTWLYQMYSLLYAHIAICNQFISQVPENADATLLTMRDEARALRALSYYWVVDLFGKGSFILDAPDGATAPPQISRLELYNWLESELVDLVDNSYISESPVYGRVGKDGVEALLARLYLNAGVYTGTAQWTNCAARCQNIIRRHETQSIYGGLAENYLALFSRENYQFMPGGGGSVNEILWGIAEDATHSQTYGGTRYLISSCVYNGDGMTPTDYGTNDPWGCLKAREPLTLRFIDDPLEDASNDPRFNKWIGGTVTYDDGASTVEFSTQNYTDQDWLAGYTVIKWTSLGLLPDGSVDWGNTLGLETIGTSSTDYSFIRLSDIYLMFAECATHGAGGMDDAVKYVNYIRNRAHQSEISSANLNDPDFLLNERSRELYWELTRRSDLIRFGRYAGNGQDVWCWKGGSVSGNTVNERYNIMPIPTQVLAAQPYFEQNDGWK